MNNIKYYNKLYIELIEVIYIIIIGGICYLLPIPDIIKAFLALPTFITIPYLLGESITPKKLLFKNSIVSNSALLWMIGLIFLTISAMLLETVDLFNIYSYILLIFAIIALKMIYGLVTGKLSSLYNLQDIKKDIKGHYREIILILLIISLPLTILMGLSPFPTNTADDSFRFSLGAQQIITNSEIPQIGVYFPFFEIIVALISTIFNIHPIILFWSGSFLSYSFYAFGMYLLAYHLSKSKQFSLIMVLLAVFPFYSKAMNLYRFIPQTWIYIVFPFALYMIYRILYQDKDEIDVKKCIKFGILSLLIIFVQYKFSFDFLPSTNYEPPARILYFLIFWAFCILILKIVFNSSISFTIGSIIGFLIFLHHPMSFIFVSLLMVYIFMYLLSRYNLTYFYVVNYGLAIVIGVAIFFHMPESINLDNNIFDIAYYDLGFSEKIDLINYAFSFPTIGFFIFGGLCILLRKSPPTPTSFFTLSLIALFIYLININILVRMLPFFAGFSVYTSAYGFTLIKNHLSFGKNNRIAFAVLLTIILPFIFTPILNYVNDTKIAGAKESISTFTEDEFRASLWIKENITNALVISDPWTQLVISGLSGSQNIGEVYSMGNLRSHIKRIIVTSDSKEGYNLLASILSKNITLNYSNIKKEDIFQRSEIALMRGYRFDLNLTKKTALIIITPRTIEYAKGPDWPTIVTKSYFSKDMFPMTEKLIDVSNPSIKKYFDNSYFELMYYIDNKIYIFKIKNPNE